MLIHSEKDFVTATDVLRWHHPGINVDHGYTAFYEQEIQRLK